MKQSDLKILFMGTPEFASKHLEDLILNKYNIVGVFTNPDKPKGRGGTLSMSPVKEVALNNNIKVFQPRTLKNNDEVKKELEQLNPDVIVVVAYGKILPKYVLDYPKYSCINVHGSILPKYRGAAPIQWSIINGDEKTGITIMYMDEGMDTGDIISILETKIDTNETLNDIYDKLLDLGKKGLKSALNMIIKEEKIPRVKQTGESSLAPMLTNENTKIDFNTSATFIHNLVRGIVPYPCAWCMIDDTKEYKVYEALEVKEEEDFIQGEIGEVIYLNDKRNMLIVKCNDSYINLTKIKPKNSRLMTAAEYIRGNKIKLKDKFI